MTPAARDVRRCAWCRLELSATARADAVTCSKSCRQARSRFRLAVGVAPAGTSDMSRGSPRRFAYADPPYPGNAKRLYGDHPDYAGEVDHAKLIASLSAAYDGWALSTSASALPAVLAMCPAGVRVAAWVCGAAASKAWTPRASWEPVIYYGARPLQPGLFAARDDSLVHGVTPMTTRPNRVIGTKPGAFSRWVFELLGALPGDELVDVFAGSGLVAEAWETYVSSATVAISDA